MMKIPCLTLTGYEKIKVRPMTRPCSDLIRYEKVLAGPVKRLLLDLAGCRTL